MEVYSQIFSKGEISMKRFLIVLLALLTCFLTACGNGGDVTSETPTTEAEQLASPLTLIENGASDYKIIYAEEGEKWERSIATRFQNTIFAATGVKIPIEADTATTPDQNAKEIILATAANNRSTTYTARGGVGLGYSVFADGGRLIFEVYSKTGAIFALSDFCKECFGFDLEAGELATRNEDFTALTVSGALSHTRSLASAELPYLGAPFAEFTLACDELNYLHYTFCRTLARELAEEMAVEESPFIYDIYYGLEDDQPYITLSEDNSLERGDWRYTVENEKRISIVANGYYGFSAAIDAIVARVTANGYMDLRVSDSEGGNYFQDLTMPKEAEKTTMYAYERAGEHRVMFYNALWGDNYYQQFEYLAKHRDPFQIALIEAYAPDVLALQEINASRRGNHNQGDLIGKLEEIGYVEAIDYRVENMKPVEEGGYGTGGGGKYTREDGSTYWSYGNCAPLLYNAATTECIEAGYHQYTQQQNEGADPIGAGDAASKSLTWGVFRSLKTGEVYAVISTHMRGGSVELSQAREAVTFVEMIEEKYGCPILLGGDLNSRAGKPCYDHFTDEKGYVSLQESKIALLHTSLIRTDHGYPIYENGEMTEGRGGVVQVEDPHNSIDNILVPDLSSLTIQVLGVIADFCSLRGSDHLPIFVDFNIADDIDSDNK